MTSSRSTLSTTPKRKHQRQDSENPENLHNVTATKKRRPGRPLLSFAQLAARRAARKSARRSRRNWKLSQLASPPSAAIQSKRRNGSSALERLPVELLERIFLYALDPNFCRASPFLASAVSSERIYRTLIRLAFFKDDDGSKISGDARERIAEALKPADYEAMPLDEDDRVKLQSTILRCRWCTGRRILAQLPALMRMKIQKYVIGAGIVLSDPKEQPQLDMLSVQGRFADDKSRTYKLYILKGTAPDGGECAIIVDPLVTLNIRWTEKDISWSHRVMDIRVLPDYLLRGRRTEDDIDLLEIFRQEYGLDGTGHDVHFSKGALESGIRTAITIRDMRALNSLLKVHEFFFRQRWETDPPLGCANQRPGQRYTLPEEFFFQAIRLPMPDAMHIFTRLFRCNAESIPPNSSELTQWAMDLGYGSHRDNEKMTVDDHDLAQGLGSFLLDFMTELPGYDDEGRRIAPDEELFRYGMINNFHAFYTHIIGEKYGPIAKWAYVVEETSEAVVDHYSFDAFQIWRVYVDNELNT
ncbi:conserved hypothetical protein [Talaromyces stipitatus ATCC 10500]|uniref:F-box domain-containing protein n=1 Tax=Talaromyces stipitatus (strain ATCC 10500 / CBS 375.48 / QM 6759 / NRRL 1006) TaxID=441959 RepID=B8M4P6_TALSN|nr:uncharacterized protein TSTA_025580 [Talaromyces stipitatus ATCC 10500]EED19241.1 conserved hypothetical protein [Talaromyces stipitatus ATCC 10500]